MVCGIYCYDGPLVDYAPPKCDVFNQLLWDIP